MIPKPFARVRIGYGPPLAVAPGQSESTEMMNQAAAALRGIEETIAWPLGGATATV
jgi:hypothetical protein